MGEVFGMSYDGISLAYGYLMKSYGVKLGCTIYEAIRVSEVVVRAIREDDRTDIEERWSYKI